MALIYCKECGKQISSDAPTCPHCGCPQQALTTSSNDIHLGYMFVSFLFPFIGIILMLVSAGKENKGRLKSAVIGTCVGIFIYAIYLYSES